MFKVTEYAALKKSIVLKKKKSVILISLSNSIKVCHNESILA